MLDQETLRPVIIAMALYLALSQIVPEIFKKPTNIKIIDDIVAMLIAQRGSLTSGTILTGIIVLLRITLTTNSCKTFSLHVNIRVFGDPYTLVFCYMHLP